MSLSALCAGCSSGSEKADNPENTEEVETFTMNDFVMSTVLSVTLYGDRDLTGEIRDLLDDLEMNQLSWRISTSTVAGVNKAAEEGKKEKTNPLFADWMKESLDLAEKSGGAFDPSIGRLVRLWDIEGDQPHVPSEEELVQALENCGYSKVSLDEETTEVRMEKGVLLDLGAAGKGIACDQVRAYLEKAGQAADEAGQISEEGGPEGRISGAVAAVGGSILVYGSKPGGDPWTVAIQDPRDSGGNYMGVLKLNDTAMVSTSGDYEKYFEEDGKRYHHILDPHTGYPADSGLISVTVVSDSGILSDGLSTACFVLGREKGTALLKEYGAEGIFIDSEKRVAVTDGLAGQFEILNEEYVREE